jgi:hypothetical protein
VVVKLPIVKIADDDVAAGKVMVKLFVQVLSEPKFKTKHAANVEAL